MKSGGYLVLAVAVCGVSACASRPPDDQSALLQKTVFIVGDGAPAKDQATGDTPQPAGGSGPVLQLKHLSWYLSGR